MNGVSDIFNILRFGLVSSNEAGTYHRGRDPVMSRIVSDVVFDDQV